MEIKEFFAQTVDWFDMNKYTIQVCLTPKDLEFIETLRVKHELKNISSTVRTMIARYRGMEDYIVQQKSIQNELSSMRVGKPIKE